MDRVKSSRSRDGTHSKVKISLETTLAVTNKQDKTNTLIAVNAYDR